MSVLTRKQADAESGGPGGLALQAAKQTAAVARQAVPIAKNAGLATRHGAEGAIAWATPHVDDARSWAAPHIEQAGIALRDSVAPRLSAGLVAAAHRLDSAPPPSRRWPKMVAGSALLAAAAAGATAAILMRRRNGNALNGQSSEAMSADGAATAEGDTAESDGSGPPEGQES